MTRLRLHVAVLLGLGLLSVGCGKGTGTGAAAGGKPLPPEYRTLATNLSLELRNSTDQFRDDQTLSAIIAEGHASIMALRGIQSSDPDITYIATEGASAGTDLVRRFERINALPRPPGAGELFFSSFVDGFFGNFSGGYARGRDAEDKQNAIAAELQALRVAAEKADAVHQLLPRVAEKYSAPITAADGRIAVDFDESVGWPGTHDWCFVYNRGPALADCTIVVRLTGVRGDVRTNVHFIKDWPAQSWQCARYESGTTVPGVQKADVTVYSPTFATAVNYVYQGAAKDRRMAEKFKNLKLSGRYQPFESGFFSDTQRGARFTLAGVPFVGKCRVDVTFHPPAQGPKGPKAWYWEFDSWKAGEEKTFATQKGQLTFDPVRIDIMISFPGTGYRYEAKFAPDRANRELVPLR